jgi:hypothetical protein
VARESDFANRMEADATLTAILTGGVYEAGEVGLEGITRETTPAAFSGGYLLPCSLVRQRDLVPDGIVEDDIEQDTSVRIVVEVWLYEDRGYTNIDAAINRLFTLFQGWQPSDAFPVKLINQIDRQRDPGALAGASLARLDWEVFSVKG